MRSENIEEFIPESLRRVPRAPVRIAPLHRSAASKAIEFFILALLVVLAMAWLLGLIDPPSQSDAMQKAHAWARDKAPIGSQIRYNQYGPVEETFDGVVVRLIVDVPGEREPRYVHVNLRQRWRWWVVE